MRADLIPNEHRVESASAFADERLELAAILTSRTLERSPAGVAAAAAIAAPAWMHATKTATRR